MDPDQKPEPERGVAGAGRNGEVPDSVAGSDAADGLGWGAGVCDVVAGLDLIDRGIELVLGASLVTLTAAQQRAALGRMIGLRSGNEAAYLHLLAQYDQLPTQVPGVTARRPGLEFLAGSMNFSKGEARSDLAAAHAVDPTGAGYDLALLDDCDDPDRTDPTPGTGPDAGSGAGAGTGTAAGCGTGSEGLPRMGAALAAGLISRAHVDVAVRCLARVPQHLANRVDEDGVTGRTRIDAFLTARSRQFCPTTTQRLATELLECLDPGGRDRFDPLAHKRRTLSLVTDSTGMTSITGLLDGATAALFRAALAHYGSLTALLPDPDEPSQAQMTIPLRDDRSPGQRRADSLRAMCEAALRAHYPTLSDGGPGTQPAAPLVKVVIVATPEQAEAARRATPGALDRDGVPSRPPDRVDAWAHPPHNGQGPPGGGSPAPRPPGQQQPRGEQRPHGEQLPPEEQIPPGQQREDRGRGPAPGQAYEAESGSPISPATFGRLLCDAELQTVVLGKDRAVLDLGRTRRLATASQRTALVARDRGCVVPGCGMPPSACEAHHVTWWRDGGRTDIGNLALVCGRHHTVVHTGEWVLQMMDGVPHAVAPSWVDPTRTPRRNTLFDAESQARRLGRTVGRQQRLPFDR